MTNKELAKAIIEKMGGAENITQSWHCITRLRFNFVSRERINVEGLKGLDGVIGAQFQSGQFQVIVGGEVANIFSEVSLLLDKHIVEGKKAKQTIIETLFDTVSGIFTPIITAISGAGLLKGLMALLVALNLLSDASSTYQVLNMISDATFHFLPFLIAVTAARKFETNMSLSVSLAGILMYPTIMNFAATGEVTSLKFIGLSVPMNSYASSVLPIILGVLLLSYVHRFINKIIPASLSIIFTPLLTLLITAPITLIVIAPLGNYVGVYLERFFTVMFDVAGPLAGLLMGGLMPLIVITGMHYAFFPGTFASFDQFGYDIMLLPMNLVANIAQAGAVLAVMIKTKDKKMRQLSFSTFIPAVFGITEPAIYGVTLKLKTPFYASLAGGAAGGALFGLLNVKTFAFTNPGIMALTTYLEKGTSNFIFALLGMGTSFTVAFILTMILKTSDNQEGITKSVAASQETPQTNKLETHFELLSPLTGQVVSLKDVPDTTFSTGLVGKGVAIEPTEGSVKSPFSGKISMLTPTNHAIGIQSEDGVELLIHIGLETVKLEGVGFELLVSDGQEVKMGQELMRFNIAELRKQKINLVSPVVITNSPQFLDIIETTDKQIEACNGILLTVIY